jgi:hypothetical protein
MFSTFLRQWVHDHALTVAKTAQLAQDPGVLGLATGSCRRFMGARM